MLFNSYIFVLLFLPLCVAGYFVCNRIGTTMANVFLLGMSLWFYGYFNAAYLILIVSSVIINYILYRMILSREGVVRKAVFLSAVLFHLGLLFYFKYYNFFLSNLNEIFRTDFPLKDILLPLGISFFTFQQLAFVIDAYRGEKTDCTFLEYALFVTFFPQLVAGPIVLHHEMLPQIRNSALRRPSAENLSTGIMIFTRGLAKKVLLADTFGRAVSFGFQNTEALHSPDVWCVMLAYTFQIYFDFSGYSDMASGIARMFNFRLPQNFDSPYQSFSVTEFWKKWHMTLTRFLRTYVYIPLGGNREGKMRAHINLLAVFFLSGVWHGANWTFILWGVLHGIACTGNRLAGRLYDCLHAALRWGMTFLFLNVTWLLFRAESVTQWLQLTGKAFTFDIADLHPELKAAFMLPESLYLYRGTRLEILNNYVNAFSMLLLFAAAVLIVLCAKNVFQRQFCLNIRSMLLTAFLFLWALTSLGSVTEFLYFNF